MVRTSLVSRESRFSTTLTALLLAAPILLAPVARAQDRSPSGRGMAQHLDPSTEPGAPGAAAGEQRQEQVQLRASRATAIDRVDSPSARLRDRSAIDRAGLTDGLPLPAGPRGRRPPPNGKVLGLDVASLTEDPLLRGGKHAAIYGVAASSDDYHPEREPLLLVHGIHGDFQDFAALVPRLAARRDFQLHVLAYADWTRRTGDNGKELAEQLAAFEGRSVTILAHSMGGIVARRAINELVATGAIRRFDRIRVLAVDTPWTGFSGPKDGVGMRIARVFMPDGLEDMRAKSPLFIGNPRSQDPAEKAGLFGVALPANVSFHLVFAQEGDQAIDYTEGKAAPLAARLADEIARGTPVSGDVRLEHELAALRSSEQWPACRAELEGLARKGSLDEAAARATLEKHFPRLPGDHSSVLAKEPLFREVDRFLAR